VALASQNDAYNFIIGFCIAFIIIVTDIQVDKSCCRRRRRRRCCCCRRAAALRQQRYTQH
jgi:hypothetical protein